MSGRIVVGALDKNSLEHAAAVASGVAKLSGASLEAVCVEPEDGGWSPEADLGGLVDSAVVYRAPAGGFASGAFLARALEEALAKNKPDLVVLSDHPTSREAAARLALRIGAGCVSMCDRIWAEADGEFRIQRDAFGGVATATYLVSAPAVCVLAATAAADEEATKRETIVERRELEDPPPAEPIEILHEEHLPPGVDLADARRIISVGRGFTKADDIGIVDGLRSLLEAELGCSRPIAEDFKWLPQERLVGLTGTSVTPDLYLALGISGQVQHLAGIKGARIVAAVNNDPKSPIVRNADYTIIGDLYKVIPALEGAIEARRNGG